MATISGKKREPGELPLRNDVRGFTVCQSDCAYGQVETGSRSDFGVDSFGYHRYQGAKLSRSLSTKGEADVVFKGLIAAASAVALSATPAIAAANGSAAAARAASVAAPAAETVEDDSELFGKRRGGFIIPLLVIIVIIIGIYIAVDDDDDGPPVSP